MILTRKKTGPKPKLFSELIRKNAESENCAVIRVSDQTHTAVIRCLSCSRTRVADRAYRIPICVCKRRRPFYLVERTVKSHRQELADRGLDSEYRVLSKISKDVFRYKHLRCGRDFRSHMGLLWQNTAVKHFCGRCREDALEGNKRSLDLVLDGLMSKAPTLELKSEFVPGVTRSIKVLDTKCGHYFKLSVFKVTEKSKHASLLRCPVCHPRSVWFEFKVRGKQFKTRSRVEQKFVEILVKDHGVDPSDIVYEPRGYQVRYTCPLTGKSKMYIPDFRVKEVLIEVKDRNSLGVGGYYHWQSKEEALIVNRAKCEAARREFHDYRTYVLAHGKFHRVGDFWKPYEQNRINSFQKEPL